MKTKIQLREEAKRKEFWAIIKTQRPRLYRALELAGDRDSRLLAVCASALVKIAMQEKQAKTKKERKPSLWQVFLGEQMRAGKTIQESAILWKEKKQVL